MANLKEGTRRLALFLGVAGAIVGGYVSFLFFINVRDQWNLHNRFERLATSDAAKQERKILQTAPDFIPDSSATAPADNPYAKLMQQELKQGPSPYSILPKDGIRAISWTKDYAVESIETEDGLTLVPTPTPAAYNYFLILLWPCLGFLIPWGVVRAIGWVVTGFIKASQ